MTHSAADHPLGVPPFLPTGGIKRRISQRFSRAAGSYQQASPAQEQSAAKLFALLRQHDLLQGLAPGSRLLDVGVGSGRLFALAQQYLVQQYPAQQHLTDKLVLHGIDFAPGMLQKVRRRWPEAHLVCADAEEYSYPSGSYHLIVSNFALQWFAQPVRTLESLQDALCPGGVLAVALPLRGSLSELQDLLRHCGGTLPLYPLPDWRDFAPLQSRASLLCQQSLAVEYDSAFAALQAIKRAGAHTVASQTAPLSYAALAELQRQPGPFCLHYCVLFCVVQKPC